ncbi:hypothetical protein GY45DRAFT_1341502 [Cubamyces sp. BRFM 1775]|nr:hypothetical protein GY45DRAFT_1341502 [Cubamyces sp. BRFM 1775]
MHITVQGDRLQFEEIYLDGGWSFRPERQSIANETDGSKMEVKLATGVMGRAILVRERGIKRAHGNNALAELNSLVSLGGEGFSKVKMHVEKVTQKKNLSRMPAYDSMLIPEPGGSIVRIEVGIRAKKIRLQVLMQAARESEVDYNFALPFVPVVVIGIKDRCHWKVKRQEPKEWDDGWQRPRNRNSEVGDALRQWVRWSSTNYVLLYLMVWDGGTNSNSPQMVMNQLRMMFKFSDDMSISGQVYDHKLIDLWGKLSAKSYNTHLTPWEQIFRPKKGKGSLSIAQLRSYWHPDPKAMTPLTLASVMISSTS